MNQVAVVIGGGQTLGEFLCRGLAAEGYRVAVVDIQSDKATRVAQEINANMAKEWRTALAPTPPAKPA
jgi:sorbitol-6-phosphate 2-dehydrogenase